KAFSLFLVRLKSGNFIQYHARKEKRSRFSVGFLVRGKGFGEPQHQTEVHGFFIVLYEKVGIK
ncbi:MAG: hypothetical protein II525_02075, partial [Bacteroidales bacterium]|nr:hypothetical protein [Bacteroidales bacterium]